MGKEKERKLFLFPNRILMESYRSKLGQKWYWNSLSRIYSNFSKTWSLVRFLLMGAAAKVWAVQAGEAMLEGLCTSSSRIIGNKNADIFLNRGKTHSANLPAVLRLKPKVHKLKVWPTAKSRHQYHQRYTEALKINCFFMSASLFLKWHLIFCTVIQIP